MKLVFVTAAVLMLMAQPTMAHHVPVPESVSDVDAFAVYLAEYTAQKDALRESFQLWDATSGYEKSGVGDALRTGLTATLLHLDSLDVRECFDPFVELTMAEMGAVADYLAHGDNPPYAAALGAYSGALSNAIKGEIPGTLTDCTVAA